MKIRILSGSQRGAVVEMPQAEAEANIATGFAEVVQEAPAEAVTPLPEVEEAPAAKQKRSTTWPK